MRKGLTFPATYEEAKTRVQTARTQIRWSVRMQDSGSFDRTVAYRHQVPAGLPPEVVAIHTEILADLERQREKLSHRVERFYRRSGKVSLVRNLLRQSPVFLRDQWVIDLMLEKRRTALLDPQIGRRREALEELRSMADALTEERLPSGEYRRRRTWRQMRADRPWADILRALSLINRYNQYVELGTCLRTIRALTADGRRLAGENREDAIQRIAVEVSVPVDWVEECWKGSVRLHQWALCRLAADEGTTAVAIRGRLEEAHEVNKSALAGARISAEAAERLRPERSARTIERGRNGGSTIHRRY